MGRVWNKDVEGQRQSCVLHPQQDGKVSVRRHPERIGSRPVQRCGELGGQSGAIEHEVRDRGRRQSLKALDCHPEHPGMSSHKLGILFALNYLVSCIASELNSVLPKFTSTPKLRI